MKSNHNVVTQPSQAQLERWKTEAENHGYPKLDQFISSMTEAGIKKFNPKSNASEGGSNRLKSVNRSLEREISACEKRITEVNGILAGRDLNNLLQFVETNPGSTYADIVEHTTRNLPRELTLKIDRLLAQGELRRSNTGEYFRADR